MKNDQKRFASLIYKIIEISRAILYKNMDYKYMNFKWSISKLILRHHNSFIILLKDIACFNAVM